MCLEAGHRVVGFDLNADKGMNASDFLERKLNLPLTELNLFDFSSSPEILSRADVVVVCVPTPLANDVPDFRHLVDASYEVAKNLRQGGLVVLESTTSPGTTERMLTEAFQKQGRKLDRDYYLGYSPERINPGTSEELLSKVPKVVSGMSGASLSRVVDFYSTLFDKVVTATSPRVAEATKLFENSFRLVNIALVNEFARACDSMGISASEALTLAATKPFGFMAFDAGLGAGGHCIPVDPSYLTHHITEIGGNQMGLVVQATSSNNSQPEFVAGWITRKLSGSGLKVENLKFGLVGVSYKAGVPDFRESKALALSSTFAGQGHKVVEFDIFKSEERQILPLGKIQSFSDVDAWIIALPLSSLFEEPMLQVFESAIRKGIPVFDLTGRMPLDGAFRL